MNKERIQNIMASIAIYGCMAATFSIIGYITWQQVKPWESMVVPGEFHTFNSTRLVDGRLENCLIQSGDTIKPAKWVGNDLIIMVEAGSSKRPLSNELCPVGKQVTMNSSDWNNLKWTPFLDWIIESQMKRDYAEWEAHKSAVTAALANP